VSTLPEFGQLIAPISEAQPSGESLEDTALLASFDAFRVFGHSVPPEPPPDWRTIRTEAAAALTRSKDVRLLAHLGAAALRTDGLAAFLDTISVAAAWLDQSWATTFPLVEEDAILRRNALNCFSDQVAMVDGVRRAPLVATREHGRIGLRDVEMAMGLVAVGEGDTPPDTGRITAAFAALALDDLRGLLQSVEAAAAALKSIDAKMRAEAGIEAAPSFDPLTAQFTKIIKTLRGYLAERGEAVEGLEQQAEGGAAGGGALGAVRSRQDAIRALDAVAEFFRKTEPSSPVPFFLDRAKRLVAKDFIAVLEDVAPGSLSQAREAVGLKNP
jgi:type VI secretion system protein ImpA